MKKLLTYLLTCTLCITALFCTPVIASAISYDQVAGEDEMTTVEEVGIAGMEPIYGKDIVDGVYDVTVESSSSMFRIEKAKLSVKDGEMTAALTLSGTSYLKLFLGTGAQAAKSDVSDYIDFVEDADGKYTYTIPVEALDQAIPCAAFSKRKEKWYDRAILFEASSLPKEAVLTELPDYEALESAAMEKRIAAMKAESAPSEASTPQPAATTLADGEYTIAVDLTGGTGKATITSPASLTVRAGIPYATIEWSSSHYDYMRVGSEKYLPINTEGNSTFEIPVAGLDAGTDIVLDVVADTTAMSTPHEIEYTLTFHADSIVSKNPVQSSSSSAAIAGGIIIAVAGGCILVIAAIVLVIALRKRNG